MVSLYDVGDAPGDDEDEDDNVNDAAHGDRLKGCGMVDAASRMVE